MGGEVQHAIDRVFSKSLPQSVAIGKISLDQRLVTDINDAGAEVVVGRKAVVTFRVACLGWIT